MQLLKRIENQKVLNLSVITMEVFELFSNHEAACARVLLSIVNTKATRRKILSAEKNPTVPSTTKYKKNQLILSRSTLFLNLGGFNALNSMKFYI